MATFGRSFLDSYFKSEDLKENKRQFDTKISEGARQFDTRLGEDVRQFDTKMGENVRQYDTRMDFMDRATFSPKLMTADGQSRRVPWNYDLGAMNLQWDKDKFDQVDKMRKQAIIPMYKTTPTGDTETFFTSLAEMMNEDGTLAPWLKEYSNEGKWGSKGYSVHMDPKLAQAFGQTQMGKDAYANAGYKSFGTEGLAEPGPNVVDLFMSGGFAGPMLGQQFLSLLSGNGIINPLASEYEKSATNTVDSFIKGLKTEIDPKTPPNRMNIQKHQRYMDEIQKILGAVGREEVKLTRDQQQTLNDYVAKLRMLGAMTAEEKATLQAQQEMKDE